MTMSIQQKIEVLKADPNYAELREARDIALELIWSLVDHERWDDFVTYFTDNGNPEQLQRLMLKDDRANDQAIRQSVCYLLANSVCGGGTGKRLHENINGTLDVGLSYNQLATREEQAEKSAKATGESKTD